MSCLSGDRTITSRPKLTLQTTALPRTFGSSTTGLSLPFTAGAAASPTVRNTFQNAYDVPSPSSASISPKGSHRLSHKPISPYLSNPSNPNQSQNNHPRPYQQPLGVRSILRNSPLDAARRSGSVSAGASVRRVFFPAKKQVTYRPQLEEEIRTVHYTAQHIDLIEAVQDTAAPGPHDLPDPTDSDTESSVSASDSSTSEDGSSDDGSKDPSSSK
ncbi:hypothetical protein N7470_004536 [Penicillium chermesinum]|nr:hypothetical protein N7470_004536 [Penicillium chermesinum]